ncbi:MULTISPECIES: PEP-CTERM sorting domain-containing protein [Planktothrix]|uniref:PEP-CTERM sorting domain-containing protein n=1 Tax=Planktothrix TaxID=54304 RepID=UPI00042539B7|nr:MULTISPECIES: PEP-CTERM sorting domain-containing protein [Planktothrix]CAD0229327.1 conserved exported hypothetical protein [Planktothrix agardhii]CAD5935156.1 hypothetical protein NO758_01538 [Planktothrix agardhii]
MKNTLSKIIGSTILTTGVAVSLVTTSAYAGSKPPAPPAPSPTIPVNTSNLGIYDTKTFGFSNVFGGDTVGDDLVGKFKFNVSKTNTNQVLFQFENTGAVSTAFISQIKFSDTSSDSINNLFGISAIGSFYNKGTVGFEKDLNNTNLAQSNLITGWQSSDSIGFNSIRQGSNKDGIDQTEKLGLLFDGSFDKVISKLNSNQLKVGMHVQGIYGKSDTFASYVAPPKPPAPVEVPEPTTLVGLALAFGGMLASRRRQSN